MSSLTDRPSSPLTVAWIPDFPIELLPGVPERISRLPGSHSLSWERVLLDELKNQPALKLHVLILRKQFERTETLEHDGVVSRTGGGNWELTPAAAMHTEARPHPREPRQAD